MGTHARLIRFEKEFKDIDLAKYYQLNNVPYEWTHIDKKQQENTILLTILHHKSQYLPKLHLPLELIRFIGTYLTCMIEIKTKIEYSLHYPFAPPIWYMEGVKHNLSLYGYDPFYLLDYYIEKINQHNHLYNSYLLQGPQWNPAISVEKDILIFLQRILRFDAIP